MQRINLFVLILEKKMGINQGFLEKIYDFRKKVDSIYRFLCRPIQDNP